VEHGGRALEQGPELGRGQVDRVQLEPGPAEQAGKVGPLLGGRDLAGEGVDADDLAALAEQGLGEVGADEAGGAGDDDVLAAGTWHGATGLTGGRRARRA